MRRIDVLFVAFGVFAGCSAYDAAPSPASDVDGGTRGDDAASADVVTSADAGLGGNVQPDGDPPIDANGERPAIDAAGCTCDCDKDKWSSAPCVTPAGDCDDLDPRAFPDAGFRTDQPTPQTQGDWNCDGKVTRQYAVNIDCQGLATTTCNAEGFTTDPACGEAATYVHCVGGVLGCAVGSSETRTQGCK